jgi:hypothetical protein
VQIIIQVHLPIILRKKPGETKNEEAHKIREEIAHPGHAAGNEADHFMIMRIGGHVGFRFFESAQANQHLR